MKDDETRWRQLDEADAERKKQMSIDELHNDGYQLYRQCHYSHAAYLFAQAASLAKQMGQLSEQCKNLFWEGACYLDDYQLKKALTCSLEADQLNGLNACHQFYNLVNLLFVSMKLCLEQSEIMVILDKLIPYKSAQQIGGSKSMVLDCENQFLISCDKYKEALAKAQEAFASRIDEAPSYDDIDYFCSLVEAYRLNGKISEARITLRRWRKEGSYNFSYTKLYQLKEELKLYCCENAFNDAWDVLQQIKAEEQYLGRTGLYADILRWEVMVGTKTEHLEQIKPALNVLFKKHRNSESLVDRYYCYEAFARYCCASSCVVTQKNRVRMERHAKFWLTKAERMASRLDGLRQSSWHTGEIQKIREEFEKT
jgi:hypothetical protein